MKKVTVVYRTPKASKSAIMNINKLVSRLGSMSCSDDLSYTEYRDLVKYLSEYKDLLEGAFSDGPSQDRYQVRLVLSDPKKHYEDFNAMLDCLFVYNPKTDGNKTFLKITSHVLGDTFKDYYDLRYDKDFDSESPEKWLVSWANKFWSGDHGSFFVKDISVVKLDD